MLLPAQFAGVGLALGKTHRIKQKIGRDSYMPTFFQDIGSSQTLKNQVYMHLRELIITGQIQPGYRLTEETVSKQTNISRAPIREALNMLEREGFVTIIPRHGAVVSELTLQSVRDIWEMRRLLEPYAAQKVMHLIPPEEIDRVYNMVLEVRRNPDNVQLHMECDIRLHGLMTKYNGNGLFNEFMETTSGHSMRARYIIEHDENLGREVIATISEEHLRIMQAFKNQDEEEVYNAVDSHIRASYHRCAEPLLAKDEAR